LLDANCDEGSRIAGILDDDPRLHGRSILGYVIMGGVREASLLLDDFAQHGVLVTRVAVCESDRNRAARYPVSPFRSANASYFRIKRLIETAIAIVSVALLAPLFVLAAVLALTSV